MRGEFVEETVRPHVTGVMLHRRPVGEAGEEITYRSAHPLLFDSEGSPIGNEMRMQVIEFKKTLQDLAGALIHLTYARVVIKIFR